MHHILNAYFFNAHTFWMQDFFNALPFWMHTFCLQIYLNAQPFWMHTFCSQRYLNAYFYNASLFLCRAIPMHSNLNENHFECILLYCLTTPQAHFSNAKIWKEKRDSMKSKFPILSFLILKRRPSFLLSLPEGNLRFGLSK